MTTESRESETKWKAPAQARLFHVQELVGVITDISVEDMFQWSGHIELTVAASIYQPMFDYFNDETREREPEEPDEDEYPFEVCLMEDWFIEDENGRREVSFPVVTSDGEVFWRD